ncbi:antirestriction protein ArdA [Actinotignum sanguinis]|uniref:antirestriction protein ArdA n=1 Tax=Actinotignum sanguinis TaxID=1445614 RepID=UPI002551206B|nr:antirestriction protein ArdA [Actinotignum sanguinis]MDK8657711.1 antirestriction protein ArdA [Actinotignum sanguinis]
MSILTRPSVWIGCLACYNNGRLIGNWFPAEVAGDITPEDIHPTPTPTSHDELWCFDLEGFPKGSGEMSPTDAVPWGELYLEAGNDWPALIAWAENGSHVEDARGLPDYPSFQDCYCGQWPSFGDYLEEEISDMLCEWPENAVRYFDYRQYERDAAFDYTLLDAPNGEVWVLANR